MAELDIKKEDAKKDLDSFMKKPRQDAKRAKEASLPEEEKIKLQKEKDEAAKKRKEAEEQAKKDEEILAKKDEELDDAQKKRKTELIQKKKEADEAKLSSAEKLEKVKKETQQRIDEISGTLKDVQHRSKEENDSLRRELNMLQKRNEDLEKRLAGPKTQADLDKEAQAKQAELISTQISEDQGLPREQRREMTKEELEAWYAEDFAGAQQWVTDRSFRRSNNLQKIKTDMRHQSLREQQKSSYERVVAKHPEMNTARINERIKVLQAEGKGESDIGKAIAEEFPKYALSLEISQRNPAWSTQSNGPELVMAEMERVLNAKPPEDEKQKQIDELTRQVQELTGKIQSLETADVGINSNLNKPPSTEFSDKQKQFIKTAREMNLPQDKIAKRVKEMEGK